MLFIIATALLLAAHCSSKELSPAAPEAKNWLLQNTDKYSDLINDKSILQLRLALKPKNQEKLISIVNSIANPESSSYHKYLTLNELTDLVSPSEIDMQAVLNWIKYETKLNIVEIPPNKDWITVKGKISDIEEGFQTKLGVWMNKFNGNTKIGAVNSYTVPEKLSHIIEFIPGMSSFSFGNWRPIVHEGTILKDKNGIPASITPDTITNTYQTASATDKHPLGSQAVIEYGVAANFNTADLQTFFGTYLPEMMGEECGTAYGYNNGDVRASVEANLDVQYIMAVGQFVNTTTYKIAEPGVGIEDQMLDYAYIVGNQTDPPLVHSISYGEYGGQYDNNTVQRFDYELQKMAARGITVMLASGDNGVGCNAAGTEQEFDYPSSIYITMVGATYLDVASGKEIGATLSSGGFSKDQYRPSWQDEAVASYFESATYKAHTPSEGFYADGRAYPDVSAFGQNVKVVAAGESIDVSGTSCSAPIFAGIIALINNELMKRGKGPMGWINPWIYSNPQMFTDVTEGSNPYERCDGFFAAPGWDPVTGMGTPIYPEMLKNALSATN